MSGLKYVVLTAITPGQLMTEVNEAIKYGYKPCGGVSYSEDYGIMQAVKKEENG